MEAVHVYFKIVGFLNKKSGIPDVHVKKFKLHKSQNRYPEDVMKKLYEWMSEYHYENLCAITEGEIDSIAFKYLSRDEWIVLSITEDADGLIFVDDPSNFVIMNCQIIKKDEMTSEEEEDEPEPEDTPVIDDEEDTPVIDDEEDTPVVDDDAVEVSAVEQDMVPYILFSDGSIRDQLD
eukprot:SAG11_NODE_16973_length_532_cov_1.143187_1_plen_177_part_11